MQEDISFMCTDHELSYTRRGLFGLGVGAASTALLASQVIPAAAQYSSANGEPLPNDISPDEALKRLMDGNGRYVANTATNRDLSAGRAARAEAQFPIAGLISCADSRVAPELAFDQGPGDLFVVRVAGNFVDVSGLASIEFGVAVLGIPLLMVLGHSGCGAISATIDVIEQGTELPGHLPELVNSLKPGVERALAEKPSDPLVAATKAKVAYNVEQLKKATPIVEEAVSSGKVKVVGGVYDIATGKVELI